MCVHKQNPKLMVNSLMLMVPSALWLTCFSNPFIHTLLVFNLLNRVWLLQLVTLRDIISIHGHMWFPKQNDEKKGSVTTPVFQCR